tara:strand:+ start:456 stop:1046 length:591 start_codon:yes stop_codon:yes gene_type:complete
MLNKITQKKIDNLIFAEYNPRQLSDEQYKQLKDSISRFGLIDPIIVNKNKDRKGIIIGGHQRVKVAKTMGIDKVPCVEIDLTYDKEKELNIRLNKNTGSWDYDILANLFEMEELKDWGFDENQLAGFTDIDYSALDDDSLDDEINGMIDGTRKAIQIEFTLEDYEQAYRILKELRKDDEYVGGLVLGFLNDYLGKK